MFSALWKWWTVRGLSREQDRQIRKHGWTGVYVGDYVTAPTWAYTIGFDETLDQPEVIAFDVPQEVANELLWTVYTGLRDKTLVLEDGKTWPEDGELPGVWRKVHADQIDEGWLTLAVMRRAARTGHLHGLEAFQLVLPDEARRLPWDLGYDERLRSRQPALYEPPGDQPRALRPPLGYDT